MLCSECLGSLLFVDTVQVLRIDDPYPFRVPLVSLVGMEFLDLRETLERGGPPVFLV